MHEMTPPDLTVLSPLRSSGKLDATFLLAIATDFRAYELPEDRLEVLVEALATSDDGLSVFQKNVSRLVKDGTLLRASAIVTSGTMAYWSIDSTAQGIVELIKATDISRIQLCQRLKPVRAATPTPRPAVKVRSSTYDIPNTSGETLLAIIDHGCPFAHETLRRDDDRSTRVLALWDQDPAPAFQGIQDAGTPKNLGYGTHVTNAHLNALMRQSMDRAGINEERCYESAGYSAMRARWTHGAAVAGLLAAPLPRPQTSDERPFGGSDLPDLLDADLVFVQLPRGIPLAPSAGATDRCILDGVSYILACAGRETKRIRIVVDYGTYLGPHDGSSLFEKALDALLEQANTSRQVDIYFASGNGYNKGVHARSRATDSSVRTYTIDWWVPPDNDAAVFADLWMKAPKEGFTLEIRFGERDPIIMKVPRGQAGPMLSTCADLSCSCVVLPHDGQLQIQLQALPTESSPESGPGAPAGRWAIRFAFAGAIPAELHAYTTWGGRNPGMVQRLKPARFLVHRDSVQGNMEVTGEGSIIGSACGASPHVNLVGGYEKWGSLRRARYSSAGQGRGGKRGIGGGTPGADLLAVTEESPSLAGLLCMGNRSATFLRVNGTSVAAPQAARRQVAQIGLPKTPKDPVPPNPQKTRPNGEVAPELDDHRGEFNEPRI